jgi:hypothetical protein
MPARFGVESSVVRAASMSFGELARRLPGLLLMYVVLSQ